MTFEEAFFIRKQAIPERLTAYGFVKTTGCCYSITKYFRENTFRADIIVQTDGLVSGKVFDLKAEEEYAAFRNENRLGTFVGEIRTAYADILTDIADNCFRELSFIDSQANRISMQIQQLYQEKPDFPFEKLPDYGVFRHPTNQKWYMLIMHIAKQRLTKDMADANCMIDVTNIKADPDTIPVLLQKPGIFPSYHMNKKNWISVILDDTVSDSCLLELIGKSRSLTSLHHNSATAVASHAKEWLIPANPKSIMLNLH